jgi:hypothetical protein
MLGSKWRNFNRIFSTLQSSHSTSSNLNNNFLKSLQNHNTILYENPRWKWWSRLSYTAGGIQLLFWFSIAEYCLSWMKEVEKDDQGNIIRKKDTDWKIKVLGATISSCIGLGFAGVLHIFCKR